jgi:DNA polymerase I-like protein with 3'-5' exonuclease and polymerase domains
VSIPKVICADFETEAILPRPKYPPKPVSLGLWWPGERKRKLMAWGHGDGTKTFGNNCTEREARAEYKKARDSKIPMLFQNAMFDQDVAETHWEIPLPPVDMWHDTMFLLFLWDPHSPSLGLKQSAERLLKEPPDERDAVQEWVLANVPEAARKPSSWGAYISKCPFQIVGPYLDGDLTRTRGLFEWLWPRIDESGMLTSYRRELRLMQILLKNAQRGMRIDIAALERDAPLMRKGLEAADTWLRKRLGDINLDSPIQLGKALQSTGAVSDFKLTAKGHLSTSKKHLTIERFKDKKVFQALTYRSQMETSLGTFMESWIELADGGDRIYPDWKQVKSAGQGNDENGARSGRIICVKPNLLNLPKKWKRAISAGYVHPSFIKGVVELPFIRRYALPSKGKRWGRRDYNQQEVRLYAHFEEGPVFDGFMANPRFDMHEGVREAEERALIDAGIRSEFGRDDAKGTVFGAFYGQGLNGLMESLKLRDPEDREIGRIIHRALHAAVPSIKELSAQLKELSDAGRPIMTWGGRLYYVEPPKYVEKFGRDMSFEYKLISYLIQGSGADVMKEAICRYYEHPKRTEEMTVSVYDELNVDLPLSEKGARQEMTLVRDVMQSIECSVPMLSDGEAGPSWGQLEKFAV